MTLVHPPSNQKRCRRYIRVGRAGLNGPVDVLSLTALPRPILFLRHCDGSLSNDITLYYATARGFYQAIRWNYDGELNAPGSLMFGRPATKMIRDSSAKRPSMTTSWLTPVDNYCERTDAGFWSEPLNALTNGAFILAAAFGFCLWRRAGGRDWPGLWLIAVVLLVGIGSFLFHTLANRWSRLADVLPIAVFIYGWPCAVIWGWGPSSRSPPQDSSPFSARSSPISGSAPFPGSLSTARSDISRLLLRFWWSAAYALWQRSESPEWPF
jgi:hypothetical protein